MSQYIDRRLFNHELSQLAFFRSLYADFSPKAVTYLAKCTRWAHRQRHDFVVSASKHLPWSRLSREPSLSAPELIAEPAWSCHLLALISLVCSTFGALSSTKQANSNTHHEMCIIEAVKQCSCCKRPVQFPPTPRTYLLHVIRGKSLICSTIWGRVFRNRLYCKAAPP